VGGISPLAPLCQEPSYRQFICLRTLCVAPSIYRATTQLFSAFSADNSESCTSQYASKRMQSLRNAIPFGVSLAELGFAPNADPCIRASLIAISTSIPSRSFVTTSTRKYDNHGVLLTNASQLSARSQDRLGQPCGIWLALGFSATSRCLYRDRAGREVGLWRRA
jgi:hypothetical protein